MDRRHEPSFVAEFISALIVCSIVLVSALLPVAAIVGLVRLIIWLVCG